MDDLGATDQLPFFVSRTSRAGLTIRQIGQMPGASRLHNKTPLCWFFMILDCSPRLRIIELFGYCV